LGFHTAKPDRHLARLAASLGFPDVQKMCRTIAAALAEPVSVVDIVLWRYCESRYSRSSASSTGDNERRNVHHMRCNERLASGAHAGDAVHRTLAGSRHSWPSHTLTDFVGEARGRTASANPLFPRHCRAEPEGRAFRAAYEECGKEPCETRSGTGPAVRTVFEGLI
jgi:hypothetical protein